MIGILSSRDSMLKIFVRHRCCFVVLGAFIIQLTLGGFYTSGNIQAIIVDYMQNNSYSKTSVNMENSVWIFGTLLLGMGAAISLGGFVEMKIGPSKTTLIGGWLMSLNICLMYVTMKTYLSVVIISYGLFAGFGMGFTYGVALGTPTKWFPTNKGLILGIVVSGISFSSLIFDVVQDAMLTENNQKNVNKLPESFFILGLIYAVIQFIGSILMKNKPDNKLEENSINSNPDKSELVENIFLQESSILNKEVEMEPHKIIFVLDFWILWMIMFLNSFCTSLITSLYIRYSAVLKSECNCVNKSLASIYVTGKTFNCFGRIFWGYLSDKKPFKMIMLIITLCVSLLIGILPIIPIIYKSWHIPIFGIWFSVIHFFISGTFSIFPAMCSKLFGMKYFVCNYGLLFTSCSVGGTIISLVIMLVFPESSKNPVVYTNMIIIGCALSFFAALLTLLFRGKSIITHV